MAIQVQTSGQTDLRLAADIVKPSYAAARSIGGVAGQVMGHWRAVFVRLPAGGLTDNVAYALLGRDNANGGNFNSGNDNRLRLGADNGGSATLSGALRLRPWTEYRTALTQAYPTLNDGAFTGVAQMTRAPAVWLLVEGISNIGTVATPVWRGWCALCPVGGAPSSEVKPGDINATWISSSTGTLLRQIFVAQGGTPRTPAGLAMEHVALVQGDFPWDTANNRPHHDAVAALAGAGSHPYLTFDTLVAAQNAGTLPYANCDQGRGTLGHWWTLASLTTGLTNSGSGGTATLAVNALAGSGGLIDVAAIAPAHWTPNPTINEPVVKFAGGRGSRSLTVTGSAPAAISAMERRWEAMADGTALPGLDWAPVTSLSAGAWDATDVLPVGGPYRLRVRDAVNTALAAASEDWLVGTVLVMHGQSGMERSFMQGSPPGTNVLAQAVAGGAQGLFLKLANQEGGTASVYAQPSPVVVRLRSGETPVVGHGAVLFLNEWAAANPGHPVLICNMAINGTSMADWSIGTSVNGGHASWSFLGTIGAVAGPASGNGSGVVESYAALLRRQVDAHMMMWTPGMNADPAVRAAYVAAIDARFSAAPAAPFVVMPPWRGHRDPVDASATVAKRQEHLDFVAQLGARGVLGPHWPDIVSDVSGGLHSAFNSAPGVPSASLPVSDGNQVGQARLGRSLGRVAAWQFDRSLKAHGPRVLAAWFGDAGRTTIAVELGRQVRTLNGAGISNQFWISTDNGASFGQGGFSVALDASGTRAVLTSTDAAFPASNCRVDYARDWPFGETINPNEANSERLLDGLLYDDQTHRGGTNLAARAGNPCQGSNRTGTGLAGVAVQARGPARLVATERWTGNREVTVRMMAADGVTILKQRTLTITAN